MPRLLLFAFMAMLALAEPISAQDAPVFAPAPPPQRSQRVDPLTSSIRGRVTTADTGAPIRGAEVRLSMDGRFSRLVTTNGEGRYELRNLPAGLYKLSVSKSGFITLEFGQRRPFEAAGTIAVSEGQTAAGNVALIRGGAIFGRVLDSFGEPSIGTRVQVLRVRVEGATRRLVSVGAGDQTDDTGAFRLYGLAPGEYYISASTGLIDAVKRDAPVYYPGTMNFAEAQPITLGAGAEASADFPIVEAARSVRVSGIVMNSTGAPAPGAMINLRSEGVTMAPNSPSALMLHDDAAPDGSFSIQNVPPGPYTLTVMLPPRLPDTPISGTFGASPEARREQMLNNVPETAALPIVVAAEDISGVSLVTRRGGRIKGQFVADTGVSRPLPKGLRVTLRSPAPGQVTMQMSGGNDTDFQLAGISGPTRLEVEGVPEEWAVKAILLDGDEVTDDAFDLTGKTGNLRVVMTDRLTSLSGTVQSNREIRDHNVLVFVDDPSKWTSPSRFVRATRADDNGRFEIRGLPPGARYFAAALDYLEAGEEQNRQLLQQLRSRATSVTLGDGEQRSIQVDLINR